MRSSLKSLVGAGAAALLLGTGVQAAGTGETKGAKVTLHRGAGLTVGGKYYVDTGKKDRQGNPVYEYAGPAPAKGASKRSGGRVGPAIRTGSAARTRSSPGLDLWKRRLVEARGQLGAAPASALPRELATGEDARVVAAIERANQLKFRLDEKDLAAALARVRSSQAAHSVALHLSRHPTPTAREILAVHVGQGGPGAAEVLEILGATGPTMVAAARERLVQRERWMKDAATGRPGSASQLEAIRALARDPGNEVAGLLRQLAADRNETVAKSASAALLIQKRAGR